MNQMLRAEILKVCIFTFCFSSNKPNDNNFPFNPKKQIFQNAPYVIETIMHFLRKYCGSECFRLPFLVAPGPV